MDKNLLGFVSLVFVVGIGCSFATAVTNFAETEIPPQAAEPTLAEPTAASPQVEEIVIPHATITYYDIFGSTESELRAQLDVLGPVDYQGYKGDANTKWFIGWNWPGYGSSSCDLSQASVSYEIEVTLPRWQPPAEASPALVAKWAAYIHALAEHEKGHVDNIVNSYPTVADAIMQATCDTADAAASAALDPIRQRDADYDNETSHGATQGARFP